jgi:hypothetical protein
MEAFAALGPERVRAGLKSRGHGWGMCFLSLATTDLASPTPAARKEAWMNARRFMAVTMGWAPWIADEIARLWDRKENAFRVLAAEWLKHRELVPAPVRPAGWRRRAGERARRDHA